jgi:hypothetical protein
MEDNLQILIYVVFGIIYLILGALKKRRQSQQGQPPQGPLAPYAEEEPEAVFDERQKEPSSLEELLERYEDAANRAKRRAAEKVETMQEQADYEFEPVVWDQPVYENLEAEALKQMEETERLKSMQEELPAAARTEIQERELHAEIKPTKKAKSRFRTKSGGRRTARDLNPLLEKINKTASSRKGMQQAMVLSEIFNRKHF